MTANTIYATHYVVYQRVVCYAIDVVTVIQDFILLFLVHRLNGVMFNVCKHYDYLSSRAVATAGGILWLS